MRLRDCTTASKCPPFGKYLGGPGLTDQYSSWPNCNKAYGTLNHLNAHVTMQKHGAKRSPGGTYTFPQASSS